MQKSSLSIVATGKGLPNKCVSSEQIDEKLAVKSGLTERMSGLSQRYFLDKNESADNMQLQAINMALQQANLAITDIDCVINASATMRQAIPFNAAHTLRLLDSPRAIAGFDVNMTCLSALRALDLASLLLARYKTILIVSCDVASVGLDWQDFHSSTIFGDGAAAMIVRSHYEDGSHSQLLASHFAVYPQGYEYCTIPAGGYHYHPAYHADYVKHAYFHMQGMQLYKLVADTLPDFLQQTLSQADLTLNDIDWVVPHQASRGALNHMISRLNLDKNKVIDIFSTHGNQVAVSIPTALHHLLQEYPVKKGDKVLLCGTSAGVSLGAMLWQI
ncbi:MULTISPECIES: 3-oxoacyl-[acyl-carrier-protein] synthase III C-terminal domain-containing protein [unclassified Acinetobacter]|uniref:3-oxoacyl-[acyl-carrier-protein] synthase III C-terminal domain-containing protein n=1 Tax=unclassified Acinetobacter TaxID=196816 RepID=UPI0035BA0E06